MKIIFNSKEYKLYFDNERGKIIDEYWTFNPTLVSKEPILFIFEN